MICENCHNYNCCDRKNEFIERCDDYRPMKCHNCYKYPFCDRLVEPKRTWCSAFEKKREMLEESRNERNPIHYN